MKLTTAQIAEFLYRKDLARKNLQENSDLPEETWDMSATIMALLFVCGATPESEVALSRKEIEETIQEYNLDTL